MLSACGIRLFAIVTTGLVIFFYGWMMLRAGAELPYKFGEPDTLSRLFFHVSGGAFIKTKSSAVRGAELWALRGAEIKGASRGCFYT